MVTPVLEREALDVNTRVRATVPHPPFRGVSLRVSCASLCTTRVFLCVHCEAHMKVLFENTHRAQSRYITSAVTMSIMLLGAVTDLRAQESPPADTTDEQKARPTGLPDAGDWTFNMNAGIGAFAFSNALYADPRPDPSGDLSSNWQESYVKPALTGDFKLHNGSAVFAKGSVVGARTFSAPPSIVGESASGYHAEDLYIGWRSGTSLDLGEDAIQVTLGRAPYKLGHGFLIYDGSGDGGSRG